MSPPGMGRGTMRSMVEGPLPKRRVKPWAPSTTPDCVRRGPPPRSGEDR